METQRPTPGLLVLTDTYYPGWEADIDGTPAPIIKADWAFRAVALPAGTHTVTMTYEPVSVTMGIAVSIISMVIVAALTAFISRILHA